MHNNMKVFFVTNSTRRRIVQVLTAKTILAYVKPARALGAAGAGFIKQHVSAHAVSIRPK